MVENVLAELLPQWAPYDPFEDRDECEDHISPDMDLTEPGFCALADFFRRAGAEVWRCDAEVEYYYLEVSKDRKYHLIRDSDGHRLICE